MGGNRAPEELALSLAFVFFSFSFRLQSEVDVTESVEPLGEFCLYMIGESLLEMDLGVELAEEMGKGPEDEQDEERLDGLGPMEVLGEDDVDEGEGFCGSGGFERTANLLHLSVMFRELVSRLSDSPSHSESSLAQTLCEGESLSPMVA